MKTKYDPSTLIGLFCLSILLLACFYGSIQRNDKEIQIPPKVEAQEIQVIEPTPTPTPILSEKEQIIQEIINVFGADSDKAFLLLMGKDNKSCAENRMLDPKAVNDNTSWGGIGIDRGIFQINDFYHPSVSDECAFDYKCNIRYAKRMFDNDHGSFIRWSCGKHYGI